MDKNKGKKRTSSRCTLKLIAQKVPWGYRPSSDSTFPLLGGGGQVGDVITWRLKRPQKGKCRDGMSNF